MYTDCSFLWDMKLANTALYDLAYNPGIRADNYRRDDKIDER